MIQIYSLLIGQPQTITDERGTWQSAIFRSPVNEPVALDYRGLAGDRVADTRHHGSADQAVCCHPLDHYTYWNEFYGLDSLTTELGPGSVGENWTLSETLELNVFVGDIYRVGTARVEVTGPRYPCHKQERKLKLPGFQRRVGETLRTGWYLRVRTPGTVQTGDELILEERPQPELSLHSINVCAHQTFDPTFAEQLLEVPELAACWKRIFQSLLNKQAR